MPASHRMHPPEATSRFFATPIQVAARALGMAFLLAAALGFFVFDVSVLHRVLHLVLGLAGLVLARSFATARAFLLGGGATYLAACGYGVVMDGVVMDGVVTDRENAAHAWLDLGLAVGMIVLGAALGRPRRRALPSVRREDRATG